MTRRKVDVTAEGEIVEGHAKAFEVGSARIVLCRVEGRVFAIDDVCTHDDGPLGDGCLIGFEIECPRHGARFDVRNGAVTRMPAVAPIATFPTTVEGGRIHVAVEIDED